MTNIIVIGPTVVPIIFLKCWDCMTKLLNLLAVIWMRNDQAVLEFCIPIRTIVVYEADAIVYTSAVTINSIIVLVIKV